MMRDDMKYILLTKEQIAERVKELGAEITRDYAGKKPLMVCILKGSVCFFADLIRAVDLPVHLEFMSASSYGNATVSSGKITVSGVLDDKIVGQDVILVEDIIDSGRTIAFLKNDMLGKGVASLKVCSLLDKPSRRVVDVKADYSGFEIPDEFVVGCGLDYDQDYRNFPDIGVLKPEVYGRQ